jgi:hypothetical protein
VVIGREARYVTLENAMDHVAGLVLVNDLSEREFQLERGSQWDKGKGCDTFGPFGPYLVTMDEVADVNDLNLWLDLNGKRMQTGNTRTLIFDVPFIVHYLSQFMSLQPGDIISTGTPAGVGLGMNPPGLAQGRRRHDPGHRRPGRAAPGREAHRRLGRLSIADLKRRVPRGARRFRWDSAPAGDEARPATSRRQARAGQEGANACI